MEEINSSIKMLKSLQNDIKFQWLPFHFGIVGNVMANGFTKKGTTRATHIRVNYHFTVPN